MTSNPSRQLINDIEALLATSARLFASEGSVREVAILANAKYSIDLCGEEFGQNIYYLYLQVPDCLYSQISDEIEVCEDLIQKKVRILLRPYPDDDLANVIISPILSAGEEWREKAKNWVTGKGVNNQGRVRSDNIASRTVDGLLFRSQNEELFYKALKSLGVSFAPLPVFIRGGDTYKRIEPDFVIVKNGVVLVVEVDGDTVHNETPAEAHDRTTMLAHEGVHIERIRASECQTQEQALACAKRMLQVIDKIKSSR
jgi:hypothetical protein